LKAANTGLSSGTGVPDGFDCARVHGATKETTISGKQVNRMRFTIDSASGMAAAQRTTEEVTIWQHFGNVKPTV